MVNISNPIHLWQKVLTKNGFLNVANHKATKLKNLRGAVGYMVEGASKKDFAPGKGRILKETMISIGMLSLL